MGERAGIALCLMTIFAADRRAAAADADVAANAPPSTWRVNAGLNLIYLRASARTLTFSGQASLERKTPEWIFGVKANGAYGTSRPAGSADSQVVALAAALQARVDRWFSQSVSAYVLGGIETDHVQSVEAREYGEAGASMVWFDIKEADYSKIFLRTDLVELCEFGIRARSINPSAFGFGGGVVAGGASLPSGDAGSTHCAAVAC